MKMKELSVKGTRNKIVKEINKEMIHHIILTRRRTYRTTRKTAYIATSVTRPASKADTGKNQLSHLSQVGVPKAGASLIVGSKARATARARVTAANIELAKVTRAQRTKSPIAAMVAAMLSSSGITQTTPNQTTHQRYCRP
jgi:hypothetical protein